MDDQTHYRRRQIALRFFTYGLMTLTTLVGVIICVAWAMGYRFDLQSGQVSQVALLQFNSFPTGASVDINNSRLDSRTPTRANIKTGSIKVKMSLQNYRPWSKTISALPSSVRWLDYVRFVPQNVQTSSIKSFSKIDQMEPSPDKNWLAIIADKSSRNVTLANISDPNNVKFSQLSLDGDAVSLPQDRSGETFSITEWDGGSHYLIIKHTYDNKIEYLRINRQTGSDIKNITKDFGMDMSSLHFSGNSGNLFFALTGSDLRKLDYGNKSVSAPLASHVTSYRLYENDDIAFVTEVTENNRSTQRVSIYSDDKVHEIRSYDDIKPTIAEMSEYNGKTYLAVARDEIISIYTNPLDKDGDGSTTQSTKKAAYLSSPGGADWMEFNPGGRFVVAGKGAKLVSYDVEMGENYSYEIGEASNGLSWLDDYHVIDSNNDTISMMEFDGQNREDIVSGVFPATLSSNGKYLFSLDNISGGVMLQRSSMITDD